MRRWWWRRRRQRRRQRRRRKSLWGAAPYRHPRRLPTHPPRPPRPPRPLLCHALRLSPLPRAVAARWTICTCRSSPAARRRLRRAHRAGSGRRCSVQLDSLFHPQMVSREHCALSRATDGRWWLEELGSRNGTSINTQRLRRRRPRGAVAGRCGVAGLHRGGVHLRSVLHLRIEWSFINKFPHLSLSHMKSVCERAVRARISTFECTVQSARALYYRYVL